MAAFVEGTLPAAEVAAVARHLAECADCRTVVSETARFNRDAIAEERGGRSRWWTMSLAAAAVLAVVMVLIPFARSRFFENDQRARLITAAPAGHRLIASRLSGFRWARLQPPARGTATADPADLKFGGVAGDVLQRTERDPSAEGLHAAGIAYLVTGQYAQAIASLERAARAAESAEIRSDLAAARYAFAVAEDRPSQLALALADADRALALDPRCASAQFNRALILEKMEMRDRAREAWEKYLTLDARSEWSVEAQEHLRKLGAANAAAFDSKALIDASGDALRKYVAQFPEQSRTWGEGPLLAEWADHPDGTLGRTRAIADALRRGSGESFLSDVVSMLERARGEATATLAEAHRLYRDGRIDYSRRHNADAEGKFRRAAAMFRRERSPMADMASYYAACATWDQNRNDEARGELRELLARVDAKRHRALAAQLHWQLAVDANSIGDWGAATRHADASAALFDSLGEHANAAFMHGVAAVALEVIGERDLAWRRRIRAFAGLASDTKRRSTILHAAAITLQAVDQPSAAQSMIDLMIDSARSDDSAQLSSALTTKARIAAERGDAGTARRSISEARIASASVVDAGLRSMLDAQLDLASAVAEPKGSLVAFDRAVEFFKEGRLSFFRADAYRQRANVRRSMGDGDAALADYNAALQELDKQRLTIYDAAGRLLFLDTAAKILEETIELQLARGAIADAFLTADRAHGLLDAGAGDASASPAIPQLPPGTALVEYALLSDALVIFCISDGHLSAERIPLDRQQLIDRVASFAHDVRRRAPIAEIQRSSAALDQLLIAPVRARIANAEELIVVPDRQLYAVPFAALYDTAKPGYLVEAFPITIAPSATRSQHDPQTSLTPAVVIADPPTPRWPRLPATRDEAVRIAALHGATAIVGEEATRERFVEEAQRSALIHYSGHANSDATESYGALLLAGSGVFFSSEIARTPLPQHPLVILAACGTFRGEASHVAGAATLARAFLLAGARAVIGTLWEVDDDVAAQFFFRLHEHLRSGATPARALRATQLDMLRSSDARLRHPATWPVEVLSSP